jgi:SpoVK/Ycf46/Vps4 family AAA+-type ATPase
MVQKPNDKGGIKLKVAEAVQDDVGKGIVKIDTSIMKEVGIAPGDVVEIAGEKSTYAIADRAYPADLGLNIIRMDGLTRWNSKAGIGEVVIIRKAEYKRATSVTIAPAQKGMMIQIPGDVAKQALLGRAVVKGDVITLGGTRRRRKTFSGHPFEEVFRMIEEDLTAGVGFGFGDVKFSVVNTGPKGPVLITNETAINISPTAVELVEKKLPEVSYEDIGGLGDELSKVRELVEIPLKHPEIFERLGIEPPKGVLLYGPPGTGKTLLARAVANEADAYFISIAGPEVMCVGGDTKVLLNPHGYVSAEELFTKAMKDGKLVCRNPETYELRGFKTFAADRKGKLRPARITHVTRLDAPSLGFEFSDGQGIVVSENQPFLVTTGSGELDWKTSRELKVGDWVAKAGVLSKERGCAVLPVVSLTPSRTPIKTPRQTSMELLELLGLMLAEGSISKRLDAVEFANENPELQDRFVELTKRLFGIAGHRFAVRTDKVSVYSKQLCEFLVRACGLESGKKKNKALPGLVFSCSGDEAAAFVRGYFEGDGTVGRGPRDYPTIRLYSASKDLLLEFQALLQLRLGIQSDVRRWQTPLSEMWALVVKGFDGRSKFAELVGAVTADKKSRLSVLAKTVLKRSSEFLPEVKALLRAAKDEFGLKYVDIKSYQGYFYGHKKLTRPVLRKIISLFKKRGMHSPSVRALESLLDSDLVWTKVTRISDAGRRTLYDLSVEKHNNFVGGPLLILHNSKWVGEAEKKLRQIFEDAEKNAPAIIFIDEVDAIAPKREEAVGEVERRVVAQLLAIMDGLKSRGKVIVIAATNRPNDIDPALRRPGRFDREIEIGVPDRLARLDILKIHTRNMPLSKEVDLKKLADITHGFVGADVAALCKEAAMNVLRRMVPDLRWKEGEPLPRELLERLIVNMNDFKSALKLVRPSLLREVLIETPKIGWSDIGGLEEVKQQLKEAVEWPLKNPKAFSRLGVRPPKGILLIGPPGTGKTLLAKAVAKESEANFISVKGPEIISKWVGESEKAIREIFRRARQASPCVVFFDELDSIAPRRGLETGARVTEQVIAQMLTEMDGLEELTDVVVIAATNRPDIIDPGLLRPGRFDRMILVPAPDKEARFQIIQVHTQNMPLAKGVDLKEIADETDGYSGADLEAVAREAAILALREDISATEVTAKHFEQSMQTVKPSLTKADIEVYAKFVDKFKTRKAEMTKEIPYFG